MQNQQLNNAIYILIQNLLQFWNLEEQPFNLSAADYGKTDKKKLKNGVEEVKLTYYYRQTNDPVCEITIKANVPKQKVIEYNFKFLGPWRQ